MSLTFHQTFALDCENLAKLLSLVRECPFATNLEISQRTGIGIGKDVRQGKVQPTVEYAIYGGMLAPVTGSEVRELRLTDVGKIILEKDEWLKKPSTHWVLHYHLSREGSDAEAWTFFIHDFLPRNAEFERSTLEAELERQFGDRAKIRSINPGVLLTTYLDGNALGRIRFLREQRKRLYVRAQSYIPNPHALAYVLAEIWEAKHGSRFMIDPSTLLEPGHLGTTMGLGQSEIQSWLGRLTALGLVDQMREAPPHQVVRRWRNKLDILRASYEEN